MYNLTKPGTAGRPAVYQKGVYKRRTMSEALKGRTPNRRFTLHKDDKVLEPFPSPLGTMGFKQGGYFVTFVHRMKEDGEHEVTRVYVNTDSKVSAIVKAERYINKEYVSVTATPAGAIPNNIEEGVQVNANRFKDYDPSND